MADFLKNIDTPSADSPEAISAESVFKLEYIPTSKAADFTVLTSGYFSISDTSVPSISATSSADTDGGIGSETFWEIIVTDLVEEHEEKFSLHNTISDAVVIFSTGARPIAISISGYVLLSQTDDHSFKLLSAYAESFRTRKLAAKSMHLTFVSQDTTFKLIIESLNVSRTVELETYISIEISGLAYSYGQTGSTEPFSLGYYGANEQTPDNSTTETKKPETTQQAQTNSTEQPNGTQRPYEQSSTFVGPPAPKPWNP